MVVRMSRPPLDKWASRLRPLRRRIGPISSGLTTQRLQTLQENFRHLVRNQVRAETLDREAVNRRRAGQDLTTELPPMVEEEMESALSEDSSTAEKNLSGRRRSDSKPDSPRLGRRASDQMDIRGAARMLDVLAYRPSFDELARELALGTLVRFTPTVVLVGRLTSHAHLEVAGSFGISSTLRESLQSASVWDESFISRALRSNSIITLQGKSRAPTGSWEFAFDDDEFPLVAAPLLAKDNKVGFLAFNCDANFIDYDFERDLSGVQITLALYLSMHSQSIATPSAERPESATITGLDLDDSAELPAMTSRRQEVLRLLSLGLTNSQIARRIGFSESTVRHETIAIYKILGVKDRSNAARIARSRGWIDN